MVSGENRTTWLRETMVESCRCSLVPIKINNECGGGSSSVFSKLLRAFLVQKIGIIDDRNLAATPEWFETNVMAEPFLAAMLFVTDENFKWNKRLVRRFGNEDEVGMRLCDDLLTPRARAAGFKVTLRSGFTQQRLGQFEAQKYIFQCLAAQQTDTYWPAGCAGRCV